MQELLPRIDDDDDELAVLRRFVADFGALESVTRLLESNRRRIYAIVLDEGDMIFSIVENGAPPLADGQPAPSRFMCLALNKKAASCQCIRFPCEHALACFNDGMLGHEDQEIWDSGWVRDSTTLRA